jgi:succinyl-CoA synthetase beta subunit
MIASSQGGVDIEKVALENPEAIIKEPVDIFGDPKPEQTEKLAKVMGVSEDLIPIVQEQICLLYKFFKEKDVTMLEINPLVETSTSEVFCVDTKINFDDNASFRQKEIFEMDDPTQKDPREVEAVKYDLNYIGLDGNIGCLVNGAGLAMATMDIIKLHGGNPANFLDIGGGATKQQVTEAIRILSKDPKVKVILINIFGGIMRCDIIALGLIAAAKELALKIPLVVRLQGTNVEIAKQIMAESGLRILSADDLEIAAQKAVATTKIIQMAEDAHLSVSFELPL